MTIKANCTFLMNYANNAFILSIPFVSKHIGCRTIAGLMIYANNAFILSIPFVSKHIGCRTIAGL